MVFHCKPFCGTRINNKKSTRIHYLRPKIPHLSDPPQLFLRSFVWKDIFSGILSTQTCNWKSTRSKFYFYSKIKTCNIKLIFSDVSLDLVHTIWLNLITQIFCYANRKSNNLSSFHTEARCFQTVFVFKEQVYIGITFYNFFFQFYIN